MSTNYASTQPGPGHARKNDSARVCIVTCIRLLLELSKNVREDLCFFFRPDSSTQSRRLRLRAETSIPSSRLGDLGDFVPSSKRSLDVQRGSSFHYPENFLWGPCGLHSNANGRGVARLVLHHDISVVTAVAALRRDLHERWRHKYGYGYRYENMDYSVYDISWIMSTPHNT